jgi:hypothetical protein
MKRVNSILMAFVCLLMSGTLLGQQPAVPMDASSSQVSSHTTTQAIVPRLIKFNGALRDLAGKPLTGPVDVTFSLYTDEAGGSPLWFETQTVQANSVGHYTVLLGAMTAAGVPLELFTSGEAHWLGVMVEGLPEQPRVLLVSVPYALKAGDAETLGGKPASAYLLASPGGSGTDTSATTNATLSGLVQADALRSTGGNPTPQAIGTGGTANYLAGWVDGSTLGTSVVYQDPTTNKLGIGTTTPLTALEVHDTGASYNTAYSSTNPFGTRVLLFNTNNAVTGNFALNVGGSTGDRQNKLSFWSLSNANGGLGSNIMTLDSNGSKMGIGTTSPLTALEVHDVGASYNTAFSSTNPFGTRVLLLNTNNAVTGNFALNVGGSTGDRQNKLSFWSLSNAGGGLGNNVMTLDAATGNVGIGTTAPSQKLDVAGSVRITGLGNSLVFPDGSVMTSAGAGTNGGTITAVNAGAGLVGGGTAGSVTLYLDTTMVPTFATSSNVFTGDITANSFTGAVTGTTGTFTANTGGQVLGATQSGSGPAMQAVTTSASSGAAAFIGNASSLTGNTVGVWGKSASASGVAVRGDNSSTTGASLGVYGSSAGSSGVGVEGEATSTTGSAYGVLGTTPSSGGTGVLGTATASTGTTVGVAGSSLSDSGVGVKGSANKLTGNTIGVQGVNLSTTGVGVSGEASDASGATVGVQGIVNSPAGIAGVFQNTGGGDILLGKQGSNTKFLVDKDGNVTASGTVSANDFSSTAGITATTITGTTGTFTANSGGDVINITQSGAGAGLSATTQSGSGGATGVIGSATSATGSTVGVWGLNSSSSGIAVRGDASALSGSTIGLYGTVASTSGIGVQGNATAVSGTTKGVVGTTASTSGTGVEGDANTATGSTFGVRGVNQSATGTGVSGEASSSTGATVGVHGYSNSASGTAGLFENVNGGNILIGKQGSTQVFLVDADGNVTANSFSSLTSSGMISAGTADFTGANGTEIASITQGGTGVGLSATSTSTSGGATAIVADASGTSGSTNAIWATNASSGGVAVRAEATATTGGNVGVLATTPSTSGTAVRGDATATSGTTVGVYATSASPDGIALRGDNSGASGVALGVYGKSSASSSGVGVEGESTVGTGSTVGVKGVAASVAGTGVQGSAPAAGVSGSATAATGIGVSGYASSSSGSTIGVQGIVNSDSGTAGVFQNTGAGNILIGLQASNQRFLVDKDGNLTASGAVMANALVSTTSLSAATVSGTTGTFTANTGGNVLGITQSGAGPGLMSSSSSTSGGATAVMAQASGTSGSTNGIWATNASPGGVAVRGEATASSGANVGLYGKTASASGTAAIFDNTAAGDILLGQVSGVNEFRVTGAGDVFANTFTPGGADFAESVDVKGNSDEYEAGEVMAVDPQGRRRLILASEPYSTHVAGIYSTKPGVLATPHHMDDPRLAGEIPLAIVGIVPCKVTAENGPIQPGDLLVTSSTPGHAMRGTDRGRMMGAVVGKALEPLASGTGVIEVLVTLQ